MTAEPGETKSEVGNWMLQGADQRTPLHEKTEINERCEAVEAHQCTIHPTTMLSESSNVKRCARDIVLMAK